MSNVPTYSIIHEFIAPTNTCEGLAVGFVPNASFIVLGTDDYLYAINKPLTDMDGGSTVNSLSIDGNALIGRWKILDESGNILSGLCFMQ